MPTSKQVRDAIFKVRPEWKKLRRVSVRNGTEITLMTGLLSDDVVKIFDQTGTLHENAKLIANELGCTTSDVYKARRGESVYLREQK